MEEKLNKELIMPHFSVGDVVKRTDLIGYGLGIIR
jgi:hypothetical protein